MMQTKFKYIIIGAGISGLTFAAQKKGENLLIIERDSVPGGLAKSFREAGFVWDVAGHFFHFHSDDTKEYYETLMENKIQRTVTKCAKVYYADQYMDAPFQYNIHQLPTNEFIECLTDLYYANSSDENVPFAKFVRNKYGSGIADKFLIPYNEKLYACKMDELEKDSMGSFLPKLDFDILMRLYRGLKGKTYNDSFCYPVDGCDGVIDALIKRVNTHRIHYDENVISIDTNRKVVITNKNEYTYEYLINTAPLNSFAKMIDRDASVLGYNQVLVLNIGFDKPSIDKKVSWIYFPGNEIFYRVGFYNNIAGTNRLSIYVEIGYRANEEIDIDYAMDRTLVDLKRANIIDEHQVVAYKPYIINPGYAHITSQGKCFTEKFIAEMEKDNIYMIGRYARWQYSAMDDSIEQARELCTVI